LDAKAIFGELASAQSISNGQARNQAKLELKEVIEEAGGDLDEYQDLF